MVNSSFIQTPQIVSRFANFAQVGNTIVVDATNVSSGFIFPLAPEATPTSDIRLVNSGPDPVFFTCAYGDIPVAVVPVNGTPANGQILQVGEDKLFSIGMCNALAFITDSGTATIYVSQGYGS